MMCDSLYSLGIHCYSHQNNKIHCEDNLHQEHLDSSIHEQGYSILTLGNVGIVSDLQMDGDGSLLDDLACDKLFLQGGFDIPCWVLVEVM